MRLLLIEDDLALADELTLGLKSQGYSLDWLVDGRDALHQPSLADYAAIILDLGLPGINGLEVLRTWRGQKITTPVLILTARSSFAERITGLEAGADDYLCKPFHPDELYLRLAGLIKRSQGLTNSQLLQGKGWQLDESRQLVITDNNQEEIHLTAAEFSMLRYFMLNPKRLITKSQLEEQLYNGEATLGSNVVEVHVSHLRRKLGKSLITTKRGQGYIYAV